jgi:hypothetical protein
MASTSQPTQRQPLVYSKHPAFPHRRQLRDRTHHPSGQLNLFPTPTVMSLPQVIVMGPDGNLWFTEENVGIDVSPARKLTARKH